jgi:hypothetical protein
VSVVKKLSPAIHTEKLKASNIPRRGRLQIGNHPNARKTQALPMRLLVSLTLTLGMMFPLADTKNEILSCSTNPKDRSTETGGADISFIELSLFSTNVDTFTLRSVSSLNKPPNNEMKFCGNIVENHHNYHHRLHSE